LKRKNDKTTAGLKDDLVAHDAIVAEFSEACLQRVGTVLDALVCCALGTTHTAVTAVPSDSNAFRFTP